MFLSKNIRLQSLFSLYYLLKLANIESYHKESDFCIMLLMYGDQKVDSDWSVNEEMAPMFSRVYYVYSGSVVYKDAVLKEPLEKETLYVFPSNRPYEISQEPSDPLSCLFLHLDFSPEIISNIIKIKVLPDCFLKKLLEAAHITMSDPNIEEPFPLLSALSEVLTVFLKQQLYFKNLPAELSVVLQYISEHLGEPVSIDVLSNICGYNPSYFIRMFHQLVGLSPHQYIINYRLRNATHLLRSGTSVSETASQIGYTDTKTFSRAFRKQFGISPSRFKRFFVFKP